MDKVRKPSISVCYTPSSEPYSIYYCMFTLYLLRLLNKGIRLSSAVSLLTNRQNCLLVPINLCRFEVLTAISMKISLLGCDTLLSGRCLLSSSSILKMEAAVCSEPSVNIYQTTHHITEDSNLHRDRVISSLYRHDILQEVCLQKNIRLFYIYSYQSAFIFRI
jgi:hypothetical protein